MGAQFRNAGRPDSRTLTTNCAGISSCTSATIVRAYGYDDGGTGSSTGQLLEMGAKANGVAVAGSHVGYERLQVHHLRLLRVSSEGLHTKDGHDKRGPPVNSTRRFHLS